MASNNSGSAPLSTSSTSTVTDASTSSMTSSSSSSSSSSQNTKLQLFASEPDTPHNVVINSMACVTLASPALTAAAATATAATAAAAGPPGDNTLPAPTSSTSTDACPALVIVLFHGYGADPSQFPELARALTTTSSALTDNRILYVFPDAGDSRAWWPLDIPAMAMAMSSGETGLAQLVRAPMVGMDEAAARGHALVRGLCHHTGLSAKNICLGGFSQGSMMAIETATTLLLPPSNNRIGGLIILSGFPLRVEDVAKRIAENGLRGMRAYQAHGTRDPILPHMASTWLRDLLKVNGIEVQYETHQGAHDMGGHDMIVKLGKFLCSLL